MKTNVASVVVLYNPGIHVINNIKSFVNQVDKLFIVDNSERVNAEIVEQINRLSHTEYIFNKSNLGIASALKLQQNYQ